MHLRHHIAWKLTSKWLTTHKLNCHNYHSWTLPLRPNLMMIYALLNGPLIQILYRTLTFFNFKLNQGTNVGSVVGIALNGVPIFSGISELGFDAYYP